MATYVVWLDSSEAKIFALHPESVDEKKMHRTEIRHHTGVEKEQNNHKNAEKFFHQVAGALTDANEILLVGPGDAKGHFRTHLEQHHHARVKDKIVGVETVDHPSDAQILALAKKFFRNHIRLGQ